MLLAERIWALTWPASGLLLLFLALSLLGVWAFVAPALYKLALAALAGAAVYSLARNLEGFAFPRTAAAMRRLESESGLPHRPFDTVGERLAAGAGDPIAEVLWRAHESRARSHLRRIRLTWPRLSLAARDQRALRFLALLLLAAGLATAGPEAGARLGKAFSLGSAPITGAPLRLDIWIDPPAYTKLPPIFLSQGARSEGVKKTIGPVPAGSALTLRVQGAKVQPRLRLSGEEERRRMALASTGTEAYSGTVALRRNARVELKSALTTLARFEVSVAPDMPPAIAFADPVRATAQKALRIAYRTQDDYGIAQVKLRMSRADRPGSGIAEFDLPAPGGAGQAVLHANRDLTSHPWAGLPVRLSLAARDGAGQDGTSEGVTVTLPERAFANPLARALAAARRDMMRDPRQSAAAGDVVDRVSEAVAAPEYRKALLLALRSASWALANAGRDGEAARLHAAGLMWQVAIALEDGALGEAKTALDMARSALADALKAGAPEPEIAQRMAELRQALARYLMALQQRMGEAPQGPVDPQLQAITPQDFGRLLDTLENLARTGSTGEAEKLLSALDDILQNLATNPGGGGMGDSAHEEALKELGELIGQERALMDDTFRSSQEGARRGEPGGERAGADAMRGLAERQEKLRRQLGGAMTALGDRTGSIPRTLGRAERAMSAAREALGRGQTRAALSREQDALEALRDGARDVAEAMAQAAQGRPGRQPGLGRAPGTDPFGRPNTGATDQGNAVKVPTAGEAQRARAILEEIRRRAAERGRPPEELDYLDRLLQRF